MADCGDFILFFVSKFDEVSRNFAAVSGDDGPVSADDEDRASCVVHGVAFVQWSLKSDASRPIQQQVIGASLVVLLSVLSSTNAWAWRCSMSLTALTLTSVSLEH